MGRRRTGAATRPGPGSRGAPGTVYDDRWAGEARQAAGCAGVLLTLLLVVDGASGDLTLRHAAFWTGLAVLLFVVLVPARVSAGAGWLASRGLLGEHRVRTDRLLSVRTSDGVAQRLVLCDTEGGRVEVDPRVLVAAPQLWYRLETDALASLRDGRPLYGADTLRRITGRLDGAAAEAVFRTSGLR
ncbi:hypothetical protein [Streptomyces sp. AcH 505]|uniref:hypothetical protein n=1 Tax=Streptomyces sp. AcH 505 TaxID=352211 RepID=UPI0005AB49B7